MLILYTPGMSTGTRGKKAQVARNPMVLGVLLQICRVLRGNSETVKRAFSHDSPSFDILAHLVRPSMRFTAGDGFKWKEAYNASGT
jgi:hypothetical protein